MFKKLLPFLLLTIATFTQGPSVVTPSGGGGANTTSKTFGGSPSSTYTLSVVGGTVYATNNQTGLVDSSSSDLRVVWDAIVAASPNGGHFFFKNGTYNCNSLDQESTGGFTNFYCVGIPGGGSTQYAQWILEGETSDVLIDQFDSTPAQTAGTIFNLTATAVSSVAAHSKIMIIWARPDVTNSVGPMVFEKNIGLRVPTNQRGCETMSDLGNALSVDYENVASDTAVTEASLAFPVEDGSCAAYGLTGDTGGLIGLTTTNSIKQESWFKRSFCIGCDVGLDIRSEHTLMEHAYAVRGNHGIDYGVRGGGISHSSYWAAVGCGETARCLTLGANMLLGSALTIFSFDVEDACPSGGGCSTAFVPVYHAIETNVGFTNGLISYSDVLQGSGVQGLNNLFDGGGGGSFAILQATSQHNIARGPGADSFTRANAATIGPAWVPITTSAACQISGNAAVAVGAGVATCNEDFVGQTFPSSDQFSKVTVASIDSNAGSFAEVLTNIASPATATYYGYYCSHAAATGSGIFKAVASVTTTFVSQTSVAGCNAGDTIELRRVTSGANVLLYAYRNGVLDKNLATNPFTVTSAIISGGNPGFNLTQDTAAGVTATNWSGGNFPTVHGTDSSFGTDTYATTYNSNPFCAVNSVSPAACGASAAGAFVIPTTTATYTVNTTAITQNSIVLITPRTYTGNLPSAPTCVVPTITAEPVVSAISAGVSFTLTETSTTGQTCWNYLIIN
jgi:hypothetical protein